MLVINSRYTFHRTGCSRKENTKKKEKEGVTAFSSICALISPTESLRPLEGVVVAALGESPLGESLGVSRPTSELPPCVVVPCSGDGVVAAGCTGVDLGGLSATTAGSFVGVEGVGAAKRGGLFGASLS